MLGRTWATHPMGLHMSVGHACRPCMLVSCISKLLASGFLLRASLLGFFSCRSNLRYQNLNNLYFNSTCNLHLTPAIIETLPCNIACHPLESSISSPIYLLLELHLTLGSHWLLKLYLTLNFLSRDSVLHTFFSSSQPYYHA